uniref:ABC transmembrane type-1 domain-containing protein n=1 Tax=Ciona savignyi TaxID=51511 RepID=H2ZCN2_CIOSA
RLGLIFFKRLWKILGIIFQRWNSRASILFAILVVLSLLLQFVIYAAGLIPSKYYEVLGAKDSSRFTELAIYSLLVIVLNALMKSCLTYLSKVLYLTWRQTLCGRLHADYFATMNFYKLNVLDQKLDNMQRITRDVDQFSREWSLMCSRLVVVPFTLIYYSYQCFISTSWIGPVSIYIYFIVGTIVNRIIMAPIVRLQVEQEVKEGNFRFQHLQVRVNAESMAFHQAGKTEKLKSNNRLRTLISTQMSLFNWSFWLNSAVNIFDYVGGILSYLVIAIPIFAGSYDDYAPEEISALISRNSFVCIYLIYSFSQLIDMSSTVGDMAAHTHRIGQLIESLDTMNNNHPPDEPTSDEQFQVIKTTMTSAKPVDEKYDVMINTPGKSATLLQNLSVCLSEGKNILVTGPTGSGKTSLLRILAGLWPVESGSLKRYLNFGTGGVMFLPQKPYLTEGTLQDQFSLLVSTYSVTFCSDYLNWSDKLSPGEAQRLAFARLFYHSPKLAVLDEPTSGLDTAMTDNLFLSCIKRKITYFTVGHGSTLQKV